VKALAFLFFFSFFFGFFFFFFLAPLFLLALRAGSTSPLLLHGACSIPRYRQFLVAPQGVPRVLFLSFIRPKEMGEAEVSLKLPFLFSTGGCRMVFPSLGGILGTHSPRPIFSIPALIVSAPVVTQPGLIRMFPQPPYRFPLPSSSGQNSSPFSFFRLKTARQPPLFRESGPLPFLRFLPLSRPPGYID